MSTFPYAIVALLWVRSSTSLACHSPPSVNITPSHLQSVGTWHLCLRASVTPSALHSNVFIHVTLMHVGLGTPQCMVIIF